jgi:tetratricopeptide (TPR) repeat protein
MSQVEFTNVHAGRDISVSVGFTAAEVERLVQAAVAGTTQQHTAQIERLSSQLGATQAAVLTMLRSLGHDDVPVERLPDMLALAATQILTMRQALARPSNDVSATADLRRRAVSALDAGAFDEATRLLNEIRVRERDASEQRRRAAEESRADWLAGLQSEADICALLARAALAQRDVAACLFSIRRRFAGAATRRSKTPLVIRLRGRGCTVWPWQYGCLNEAPASAVRIYRLALVNAPRERVPLDWAATQMGLGNALFRPGGNEGGTGKLEEAVEAYREALKERTRERVPLDWARTQTSLGNALEELGERESVLTAATNCG